MQSSTASAESPFLLSAGATDVAPNIDGVIDPAEWQPAGVLEVTLTHSRTNETYPAKILVMHDATYLYVALTLVDPSASQGLASFQLAFNNNGVRRLGNDAWVVNLGNNFTQDDYYTGSFYNADRFDGGINDLVGFGRFDAETGAVSFEARHPLCSADTAHDLCIASGREVGMYLFYQFGDGDSFAVYPPGSYFFLVGAAQQPIVLRLLRA